MRRLIVLLVLLAAVCAAVAGYFYARVDERYQGFESAEQFVEIPSGAGSQAIGRALVASGVVRDEWTFRLAVYLTGTARELKAGEYRFAGPASPKDVARRLARGDVYLRPITFPEGLTINEMARVFESRGFGTAATFTAAASNAEAIRAIDPKAKDLEGYLFPETYSLPRRANASTLVAQMTTRFLAVFDEPLRREAELQGRTVREVVTLASLVEKETARPDERPIVAAVYLNRLRIGMGLQCDPTVIYALEKAGKYDGNLTRENLRFDSPYNTYRYAGLPPGPIAAPGRASLEAVLNPARVDYLYFVSRNDGSHVFATTLAEHNRNVREWQKVKGTKDEGRGRRQGRTARVKPRRSATARRRGRRTKPRIQSVFCDPRAGDWRSGDPRMTRSRRAMPRISMATPVISSARLTGSSNEG